MQANQLVHVSDSDQFINLTMACKSGAIHDVRHLVESGVPINMHDVHNATPLYYAALCGHREIVKYLLEAGARCEENTFDGERCFYAALDKEIKNLLKSYKITIRHKPFNEFLKRCYTNAKSLHYDFVFDAKGPEGWDAIPIHRSILSIRCSYFAEMFFDGRWKGRRAVRLNHLLDAEALSAVLRYLYTGHFEIQEKLIEKVLSICKQLKLEELAEGIHGHSITAAGWVFFTPIEATGSTSLEADMRRLAMLSISTAKLFQDCDQIEDIVLDKYGNLSLDATYASDVIFEVDGNYYCCHKVFFCGRSEYFSALLSGRFRESQSNTIVHIGDMSSTVFEVIIEYFYSNRLPDIDEDLLLETLSIADQYLLENLKQGCITMLIPHVDIDNVFQMIRIARMVSVQRLEDFCLEIIAVNLTRLANREDLIDLIRESAMEIKGRQETDSIPILDEIRTYIDQKFGIKEEDMDLFEEDDLVLKEQERQRRHDEIEFILATLGIDA